MPYVFPQLSHFQHHQKRSIFVNGTVVFLVYNVVVAVIGHVSNTQLIPGHIVV